MGLGKPSLIQKKVYYFLYKGGGGQDHSSLHFFFSKTWSKMAKYCTFKSLIFLGFSYTFRKIEGRGVRPKCNKCYFFFLLMKASLMLKVGLYWRCPRNYKMSLLNGFNKIETLMI